VLTERRANRAGLDAEAALQDGSVHEGGHPDAALEDEALLAPEPAVGGRVA
jgi:hypothetical protein